MTKKSRKAPGKSNVKKESPKRQARIGDDSINSQSTKKNTKKKSNRLKTKGVDNVQTAKASGSSKRKEKSTAKAKVSKNLETSLRKENSVKSPSTSTKKLTSRNKVSDNKSNLGANKNTDAPVKRTKVESTKINNKEKKASKARNNNQKPTSKNNISAQEAPSQSRVVKKTKPKQKLDLKANTVKTAFKKFQSQIVDLERVTTDKGRASRDYLFDQIKKLAKNQPDFPPLNGDYISFGSFARKTKIRPLNDIDLLLILNNRGINVEILYQQKASGYGVNMTAVCKVKIADNSSPLQVFTNNKNYVNSIKILNRIKHCLTYITNYKKSGKNRRMQAVTLNIKSQPWTFDIVPAIPIYDYRDKVTHFLIPDGYGNWIRTNPKIDAESITTANIKHKGKLLPILRLLKYWNERRHKPILMSYYFETLVVQTFQFAPEITNIPAALEYFFQNCNFYLMSSCPDPKRLGEALDIDVNSNTKQSISKALGNAASHARHAIVAESKSDQKTAIYWWKKVFGSEFPTYG